MAESLKTTLEHLPNEVFFVILSYLDGYNIYQAFYGLNNRFTELACSTMGKCLDLRRVNHDKLYQVTNT